MISFFQGAIRLKTLLLIFGAGWVPCLVAAPGDVQPWQDSSYYLRSTRPKVSTIEFHWLDQVQSIFVRALQNSDHARELIALHSAMGTKARSSYLAYVGPLNAGPQDARGPEVRQGVMRSIRLYAQKETKLNIFPSAWREGLRFNVGTPAPAQGSGGVIKGNPNLRYGLVLTDIEPSETSIKLASLSPEDDEIWQYAPKAKVHYRVGEVLPETSSFQVALPVAEVKERSSFWSVLPAIPSYKFSGRIAPRGLPGAGSPLPPQAIFLEQSQGFYQLEAQVSGTLKQQAVIHRFKLPIYAQFQAKQERNKEFRLVKTMYENIYRSQGFALNLERLYSEKRYQLGLVRHLANAKLELYAHMPDEATASGQIWNKSRIETRLDFCF